MHLLRVLSAWLLCSAASQHDLVLSTPISQDIDTLLIMLCSRCASCTLSCSALAPAVQTPRRH